MDKNKSIDGLATRRSKQAATSSSKKSTPKKSTTKTKSSASTTKAKTPVKKSTTKAKSTTPKKTKTPIATPAPEKPTKTDITEDFLKPVQAFDFDEQTGELKASKQPINNKKKMKKDKKPLTKKQKILRRVVIPILSLLILLLIIFIIWGNDIIAKITGGQGNVFDLLFADETYEPLKTDENGRTNILAFGTSGYDMEGTEGNGTHDGAQLTDSIMVISLNQDTGDLAMLSLPRDLKASPTCTATGKINEVYWCNNMDGTNEQAGAEALTNEVSEILDVDFQYYAHLNWGSLVSIVDTLGGINVTLDEDIEDYAYTKAVYQAGVEYTLDGGQALGLARARHGTTSGDFSRGASQQKILIAIKNKVSEKDLSVPDMINLANTLGDNLRTNFSINELKTLAHLSSTYDFDNIRQVSLIEPEKLVTSANIGGISYIVPTAGAGNYSKIQAYVAKMFSNDPRQYEDSSILVLNGTDTPGLASTEQASLEEDNYQNVAVGDAPAGNYEGEYTIYYLTDSAPGTKKLLEEKYNTSAKSADELPAGIPTNYDFVIILGKKSDK